MITDWRFLIRETRKIDPLLIEKFKKNAQRIGRPVEKAVRDGIPNRRPIRGFEPKVGRGRMAWGVVMPAKATQLKVDTRMRKRGRSIVSVWVLSPAVAMVDQAANARSDGKKTREYNYSRSATGKRRHLVNGQGTAMVRGLNQAPGVKKRNPSRYVWPSALGALNKVNAEMHDLIEQTARKLNAEILRNAK